jgi:branched-chain amino acid transport system substrate-binding protein
MHRMSSVVLTAAFVLAGCEKKSPPSAASSSSAESAPSGGTMAAPSPQPPEDSGTILVGEVGSLTGPEATFGVSTQQGIEMAINEINAAGGVKGKKIAVRVYDDQSKSEEAGNATIRLISQDHVKLILGEVASKSSIIMAAKAQEAQVPMISPSSTNPAVTLRGDYIFRVCFIDPFPGFVMAKFAKENLKFSTAAVLKDNKNDYSLGLSDVFIHKFTEMGGKVVATEAYSEGDSDFRAQLTAIKSHKPEAIYIPGYYSDVGVIAKQARELGLRQPLMGGDGWDSPKLTELGGSAINGSYFSDHYSADNPSPRVQKFIQDFRNNYHVTPDAMAALGYDAANIAADAMRRAPDLSGPAVRDALAQTKGFEAVTGVITLDKNRNATKPAFVMEVVDGKYKYVTTVQP